MTLRKRHGTFTLTLREVAERHNCNVETVRRAVKRGILPSTQVRYGAGWAYAVLRSDAESWSPGSPGRPKGSGSVPAAKRRKRVVQILVNDDEAAALESLCQDGESLSGACRRVLLANYA